MEENLRAAEEYSVKRDVAEPQLGSENKGDWVQSSETLNQAAFLLSPAAVWSGSHGALGAMAWAPLFEDGNQLVFAELAGLKGEQSLGVVSAGLGVRRLLSESLGFAGLNAFYDGLQDDEDFSYSQLGLGLEWGNGRWFSNANLYVPVGDGKDYHHAYNRQPDGYQCEASQWAEIEAGLWVLNKPRLIDPYLAIGYFGTWNGVENSNGVKVRAEVAIANWIYAGAEWRQNGGPGVEQEWRLGVRFQFAFGKSGGSTGRNMRALRTNWTGGYYGHVRRSAWPSINGCDRRPDCGCTSSTEYQYR